MQTRYNVLKAGDHKEQSFHHKWRTLTPLPISQNVLFLEKFTVPWLSAVNLFSFAFNQLKSAGFWTPVGHSVGYRSIRTLFLIV